jgi:hypothetical protein
MDRHHARLQSHHIPYDTTQELDDVILYNKLKGYVYRLSRCAWDARGGSFRTIPGELDERANTLEDSQAFVETQAAEVIQIKKMVVTDALLRDSRT